MIEVDIVKFTVTEYEIAWSKCIVFGFLHECCKAKLTCVHVGNLHPNCWCNDISGAKLRFERYCNQQNMHSSFLISHLNLVQSFCSREIIEHIMSGKIILYSKFRNC